VSGLLSRSRKTKESEEGQLEAEESGSCVRASRLILYPLTNAIVGKLGVSGELKVPGSKHPLRVVGRTEPQLPLCTYLIHSRATRVVVSRRCSVHQHMPTIPPASRTDFSVGGLPTSPK